MYPRTTHSTGSMSSLRTTSARPRTSSGTPSVALRKWLGTIWPVRSNQKTLSAVSTLPLSGMGVGWTTSYVEMRSEATINRRSPRSYISRTFPDARRGRSETGGMGRRLPGLEDGAGSASGERRHAGQPVDDRVRVARVGGQVEDHVEVEPELGPRGEQLAQRRARVPRALRLVLHDAVGV